MGSLSQQEIVEDLTARNGRVLFSQAFSEGAVQDDSASVGTEVTSGRRRPVPRRCEDLCCKRPATASPTRSCSRRTWSAGRKTGGMSLWLVPINEEGAYTYPLNTVGQEMLAPARIEFDHVKLNPEWQIQTGGMLNKMLERQYELGRILTCAASFGLAQAALDDALVRCSTRKTRGRYLGSLPQIEAMLVEMAAKIRSMGTMIERAADSVSNDASRDEQQLNCSLMKYYVPQAATSVASDALQIFGGIGGTDDSRVSRIWRDCRGNQIAQGADEMMIHASCQAASSKGTRARSKTSSAGLKLRSKCGNYP